MKKKIEKEFDEPIYDSMEEKEYVSRVNIRSRLVEVYDSIRYGIKNSGLRGKHEARTELDKNHCTATITQLKHEICNTTIGEMWIKSECPKFKDMADAVIDTYLYRWINQEAIREHTILEFSDDPTTKAEEFKYDIYRSKVFKEKIIPFFMIYFEIIVLQNIIKRTPIAPMEESISFRDLLTGNENQKEIVFDWVKNTLKNKKGKSVAIILFALLQAKVVQEAENKITFYRAIENTFGYQLHSGSNKKSYSGINKYFTYPALPPDTLIIKVTQQETILKRLISQHKII